MAVLALLSTFLLGMGGFALVFAGPDAKFGIPVQDVERAYTLAQELGVRSFGIHMMTGSAILDEAYFEQITSLMMDVAGRVAKKLGIRFQFIDIGGGLGIPYQPDDKPLNLDLLASRVSGMFMRKCDEHDLGRPFLVMEPGRYLIADAGLLLASVISMKKGEQKTFVGLDAGMHTLLRPALYDAYHHIVNASHVACEHDIPVNIVGQICENTDQFAKDRHLGSCIDRGQRLALLDAGAYGFGMSSNYNTKRRAAEVMVDDGSQRLIRRRETLNDLIATQQGLWESSEES